MLWRSAGPFPSHGCLNQTGRHQRHCPCAIAAVNASRPDAMETTNCHRTPAARGPVASLCESPEAASAIAASRCGHIHTLRMRLPTDCAGETPAQSSPRHRLGLHPKTYQRSGRNFDSRAARCRTARNRGVSSCVRLRLFSTACSANDAPPRCATRKTRSAPTSGSTDGTP